MKAAILTKLNADLTVDGIVLPARLDYGQVLVKVRASGICGAQLREIAGHVGNEKFLPHLLGHEGSGIVEAVGAGVTRVKPGDQVVMHWRKASGIEAAFPHYEWYRAGKKRSQTKAAMTSVRVGAGRVTTLSEMAVVSENRVTPVPEGTPDDLCALLGCGLSTALGTIERDAGVKFGESVLIVGCGGLGANLIRAARMVHASPIAVLDRFDFKKKLAWELGASYFATDWKNIDQFHSGYDVIIDTSGNASAITATLPLLAPSGRYIMVGQPPPGSVVSLINPYHLFGGEGKLIKATQGGGFRPEQDIPRYVRMYQSGALDIKNIINYHLPLKEINAGIQLVRRGEASRVMIQMEGA